MTQMPVPQPRYCAADFDRTLILALEVSEKSWVVAAHVPGLQGSKLRCTLSPTAEALLEAVGTYRARAARAQAARRSTQGTTAMPAGVSAQHSRVRVRQQPSSSR